MQQAISFLVCTINPKIQRLFPDDIIPRISGSAFAADSRKERSICDDIWVSSMFISTIVAPFCFAYTGKRFAGDTASDVPTIIMVSHVLASTIADSHTSCGNASPNHTTSGRSIFPHLHKGGSTENPLVILSLKSHTVHLMITILPCNSYTFLLPALWCRPSMFCVRTDTSLYFSSSAMVACPAFGFAFRMLLLLSSYHSHTSFGSS